MAARRRRAATQPVAQDVGEAQHQRRGEVARLELAHNLVQVDLAVAVRGGPDDGVAEALMPK
jgi:hypothetical protein